MIVSNGQGTTTQKSEESIDIKLHSLTSNMAYIPFGSWSMAKLTPPLQRLHFPSNRIMGRSSLANADEANSSQSQDATGSVLTLELSSSRADESVSLAAKLKFHDLLLVIAGTAAT
jgi:hypothetical protein